MENRAYFCPAGFSRRCSFHAGSRLNFSGLFSVLRLHPILVILFLLCMLAQPLAAQLMFAETPGVEINESERVMIVFWNGTEEILLICPVVTATGETDVLQITPFPSMPTVRDADGAEIKKTGDLIKKYFITMKAGRMPEANYLYAASLPKGEQTESSAEDVLNFPSVKDFSTWLTEFMEDKSPPSVPSYVTKGIGQAIKGENYWFAVNSTKVNTATKYLGPTMYRFATDKLFVPLQMQSNQDGKSTMRLITFTSNYIAWAPSNAGKNCLPVTESFRVLTKDVETISPELEGFFKEGKIPLQTWQLKAKWSAYDTDLRSK